MGGERGQASVEWGALVALLALVLVGAGAAAGRLGARGIGQRVVCAIVARRCGAAPVAIASRLRARSAPARGPAPAPDLVQAAYGADVAQLVRRVVPGLVYERGTLALPVDPRTCRAHRCADAPDRPGPVLRSDAGQAPTLFTHVVRARGATYIQFWEYFPDSTWSGKALALHRPKLAGHHADDWESFQVRVGADGVVSARASSHHGYTGRRIGPDLNANQLPHDPAQRLVGSRARHAWIPTTHWVEISRGSHAGHLVVGPGRRRRHTPAKAVALVPLETTRLPDRYAIVPPWRKAVYRDPESVAT